MKLFLTKKSFKETTEKELPLEQELLLQLKKSPGYTLLHYASNNSEIHSMPYPRVGRAKFAVFSLLQGNQNALSHLLNKVIRTFLV